MQVAMKSTSPGPGDFFAGVAPVCFCSILLLALAMAGCEAKARNSQAVSNPTPAAANPVPKSHEDLDATLWMRTSAEYHVLAVDTYQRALAAVRSSVKAPAWSALPNQVVALQNPIASEDPKLPAVILDVDETVLDNSQFQVECITSSPFQFSSGGWTEWCNREVATPVPGVIDFVKGCRKMGVAIRYVTNRGNEVRQVTLNNLRKQGLVPDDESAEAELLCKGDQPDWGSDKTSRRDFIAAQFRVVVLIGDDLNDFVRTEDGATPAQRLAVAAGPGTMWGTSWFLLPNANYGGWEKSLVEYRSGLEREACLEMKLQRLQPAEPARTGPEANR